MNERLKHIHHVTKRDIELKSKANKIIKINADMLSAYIDMCKASLKEHLDVNYLEQIAYNMAQARKLLALAEGNELHEFWEHTEAGRLCGRGHSIQRMSPPVIEAALGYCHRYEFRASPYALLAGIASELNPALSVSSIKNYIIRGDAVRAKIATSTGYQEWHIKSILTSSVFCPDIHHKLSDCKEFQWIQEELCGCASTILSVKDELVGLSAVKYNGKKDSQFLEWLYQCMETRLMDRTCELLAELGGTTPSLIVHPRIYLEHKLSPDAMQTLVILLQKEFKHISLEYHEVRPIVSNQKHEERYSRAEHEAAMHHQRIEQAEKEAIGYQRIELTK